MTDNRVNDLVKDLRNSGWYFGKPAADRIEQDAQHIDEMYELVAAMNVEHTTSKTRIEKLEAALREILLWTDDCDECDYDDEWLDIETRARKALEGKDD